MRRKSARNAKKSPEKAPKEVETPPKTRRSRRHRRSPSKSSESEEEVKKLTKVTTAEKTPEETPDTTTKSYSPSDEENSQERMWKITSSEETPRGEIQKLKICLTRPTPDSPDKTKTRRSKSGSHTEDDATTSSEDKSTTRRTRSRGSPIVRNEGAAKAEDDEEMDEKKGKGKSKGKHKSKIEKTPHINDPEIQTNNEISENVQVTPQSPSIDIPVDNENDYNTVDADDKQNVTQNVDNQEDNTSDFCETRDKSPETKQSVTLPPENVQIDKLPEIQTDENIITDDNNDNKQVVSESVMIPQEETIVENQQANIINVDHIVNNQNTTLNVEDDANKNHENDDHDEDTSKQMLQQQETVIDRNPSEIEPDNDCSQEGITEDKPQETTDSNLDKTEYMDISQEEDFENVETQQLKEDDVRKIDDTASSENCEIVKTTDSVDDKPPAVEKELISDIVEEKKSDDTTTSVIEANNGKLEKSTTHEQQEIDYESPPPPPPPLAKKKLKRDIEFIENGRGSSLTNNRKSIEWKTGWEKSSENMSDLSSSVVKIDLDCIQTLYPSIEFPQEPDLNLDLQIKERRKSSNDQKKFERKVSVELKTDNGDSQMKIDNQTSVAQESDDNSNIIAFNRKISIVEDTASKLKPPPSPSKNPVSEILFITNLVRPFTLKQLKELLERTGCIKDDGFWTDKIKSKCYVHYETKEEAEATRNALHGVQWPIGNGKKLIIDYATFEDFDNAKKPPPIPTPAPESLEIKTVEKENEVTVEKPVRNERNDEKNLKETDKRRDGPVREWDIGKKDLHRERSRSRERNHKHRRSPSPNDDFIRRKQRKLEETVPQKLMDDLFLKTKATPSVYWQPLSPEEIQTKQQQRLMRMEEHKRRIEESSRFKGRDAGRAAPSFRRRYD